MQLRSYTLGIVLLFFTFQLTAQDLRSDLRTSMQQAKVGNYEAARTTLLTWYERDSTLTPVLYQLATYSQALGESETALAYLQTAVNHNQRGQLQFSYLTHDPVFEQLHSSPKWKALTQKLAKQVGGQNLDLFYRLVDIKALDQQKRKALIALLQQKGGKDSPAFTQLESEIELQDSLNLIEVEAIIAKYGYPGKTLVGEASDVAFLVIQHANPEKRKQYLPMLQKAADKGDFSKRELAKLIDRVRTDADQKQLYGTQYQRTPDGEKWEFLPIENPEEVNTRRAQMGLPPIEAFAAQRGIIWKL